MSAATTGRLVDSGFQSALNDLIARMATDHPYHVLYQIFALKNGNLGSKGKVESGPVSMVMSRDVDLDKVSNDAMVGTYIEQHASVSWFYCSLTSGV